MKTPTALAIAMCFSALVSAAEEKPQRFRIDFLASGELVNFTSPAYSNAMLKAVLPYFSDFARKLNLPVRVPIRISQVQRFLPPHLIKRKGQVGESLKLKDGTVFGYWDGYVNYYERSSNYFSVGSFDRIPGFYGPVRMTPEEAVALARSAIRKLGYPLEDVLADLEPVVAPLQRIETNVIPHYEIKWLDPRNGGPATQVEVDARDKSIERIRFNYIVALRRPDPKVTVEPDPLPPDHLWRRMNDRANDINHEYAYRLVPVVFQAVEDWARKLNLDLPLPVTTNQVKRFYCSNNGGVPYVEMTLKNDWYFIYDVNMVTYSRSPRCFFESALLPFHVKDFVGQPRLTETQAVELARQTIAKLGYPPGFARTDQALRNILRPAEIKGMPAIPRLCFEWVYPAAREQPREQWIEVEVDCARGTAEMIRFDDVRLWDEAPDLGVPIDPPSTNNATPLEKVVAPEPARNATPPSDHFEPPSLPNLPVEALPPTVRTNLAPLDRSDLGVPKDSATTNNVTPLEKVVVPEPPRIAPPPSEPTPPHATGIPGFGIERPPPTARTMASFQRVKVGMPINDLIRLCGLPDGDWGIEDHVLIWDLDDGSWVTIGSEDLSRVDSISHQYPIKSAPSNSPSTK